MDNLSEEEKRIKIKAIPRIFYESTKSEIDFENRFRKFNKLINDFVDLVDAEDDHEVIDTKDLPIAGNFNEQLIKLYNEINRLKHENNKLLSENNLLRNQLKLLQDRSIDQ